MSPPWQNEHLSGGDGRSRTHYLQKYQGNQGAGTAETGEKRLSELALLWHSAGRPSVRVLLATLTREVTLHRNWKIEARAADNQSGIGTEAIAASAAQLGAGTVTPHRPSCASLRCRKS